MGKEHPSVAQCYNNMAVLCCTLRQRSAASEYCRIALDIRERALGAAHPETAQSYYNMGILEGPMGNREYFAKAADGLGTLHRFLERDMLELMMSGQSLRMYTANGGRVDIPLEIFDDTEDGLRSDTTGLDEY